MLSEGKEVEMWEIQIQREVGIEGNEEEGKIQKGGSPTHADARHARKEVRRSTPI